MNVPVDWIPSIPSSSRLSQIDLERWNRKNRRIAALLKPRTQLTAYALSCGYIQESRDKTVTLYHDGCYHVRSSPLRIWDSFQTLGEARKRFRQLTS